MVEFGILSRGGRVTTERKHGWMVGVYEGGMPVACCHHVVGGVGSPQMGADARRRSSTMKDKEPPKRVADVEQVRWKMRSEL